MTVGRPWCVLTTSQTRGCAHPGPVHDRGATPAQSRAESRVDGRRRPHSHAGRYTDRRRRRQGFRAPRAPRQKEAFSPPGDTACAKRLPGTPRAGEDGQGHIGIARRDLLLEKRSRARDRRKVASRIWRFLFAVQLPCFFLVDRPSVHVLLCPRWSAQLGGDPCSLMDFETLPVLAARRGSR